MLSIEALSLTIDVAVLVVMILTLSYTFTQKSKPPAYQAYGLLFTVMLIALEAIC